MSLITRCPACGTMFKVVPDQLRISEGWVRCGHCSEVFDATASLQADNPPAAAPAQAATASEPAPARSESAESAESAVDSDYPPDSSLPPDSEAPADPADSAIESEVFSSSLNTAIDEGMPSEPVDSGDLREEAEVLVEGPLDRPFVLQRQEATVPVQERAVPLASPPQLEPEPELHDLSFVRDARRKAFWAGPVVRMLLFIMGLGLALLLGAQIAIFDRDRLAAGDPALRPLLVKLCEPINCTIRPARQIDAIAIDSSAFSKLRPDTYRLSVTLKNQAQMELAMPALELTLTDTQDQAVVRRVLLPGELPRQPAVIAAGSDWSTSIALAVSANGNASRIAGYRLLAFYP